MNSFHGKHAVVTGGTRGIGRAISLALAREGAHVLALYARDRKQADALVDEARAAGVDLRCVRGDLTDDESFAAVVEEIKAASPRTDIIVHSAASGVHRRALELTPKHLRWTFDINVFALHNLLRALHDRIPAGGRIIGVTSPGGTRTIPYYAAVGSSKGALESLLRHYAVELAPRGITVNCVCPGMVLTDAIDAFPDREARIEHTIAQTPTGRLTTPEQVAALALFLCSEAAAQIVGQTITLDGGKTLPS